MTKITKTDQLASVDIDNNIDNLLQKIVKWIRTPKSYARKGLVLVIIIFGADLFENVISGLTSFSYVYSLCIMIVPSIAAKSISIMFLTCFEALKMYVYVNLFISLFLKDEQIEKQQVVLAVLLSVGSVFMTIKGTDYGYERLSKPPEKIEKTDLAIQYESDIASIEKSIKHREQNDDKSYTLVTAKVIKGLRADKKKTQAKLDALESKRMAQNEAIDINDKDMKTNAASHVKRFVILLNLLSFFVFSPILANWLIKSEKNYNEIIAKDLPSKPKQYRSKASNTDGNTGNADSDNNGKTGKTTHKNGKPEVILFFKDREKEIDELIKLEDGKPVLVKALGQSKTAIQRNKSKYNRGEITEEKALENVEKIMREALEMTGK